jgi:hypothetical protein
MNIRFHSGIPAGIQNLSSNYFYNRRQSIAPYLKSKWGRLAACGGLLTRPERRYATGAQLDKLPHNY